MNAFLFDESFEATQDFLKDVLRYPVSWTAEDISAFLFCLEYARRAHDGATRKGCAIPYIAHPVEAALIAMELTDDIQVVQAALLHDVIEDTKQTAEDIRFLFGDEVAKLVLTASENKRHSLPADTTWKIRKSEYLNHLKIAGRRDKILAVADKLSNIRAMERDYQKLGNALWMRFNQKDKKEHAWYYQSVCKLTMELSDTEAWQELSRIFSDVFGDVAE